MKWLLVVVAFVLGAAITWLLTVKRVTRVVPTEGQAPGGAGASAEDDREAEDEASVSVELTPRRPTPRVLRRRGIATPRTRMRSCLAGRTTMPLTLSLPPVADATPNGDLAGVGDPDGVAAIDEQAEEHVEAAEAGSSGVPGSGGREGRPLSRAMSVQTVSPNRPMA